MQIVSRGPVETICMQRQILFLGKNKNKCFQNIVCPASFLYKSTAGRYRPVSYPDGPITARYRFM